ncbi:RAC-gamma serine/threonine-protein kinase [Thelohanellus kitauei]|uniref:RAC-gamma serine/threonine-protein kinase n=1 Tax=Thelohanellus kitauei TaxID=669202 RepID=A0A0C2J9G8_THEKT|nr:RAC-gamma serine/threonine-protein kinase [Thelohanellus kitauei]
MDEDILKEGWISKKGEVVKNWRPRYFILKTDGVLFGFKDKGDLQSMFKNRFDILNSTIKKSDQPTPNCFVITILDENVFKDRYFKCTDPNERDEWVEVLQSVSSRNRTKSVLGRPLGYDSTRH